MPVNCQVADAGANGVFNANGTVLLGDSWVMSNGSVVYNGYAGSQNGAYYFDDPIVAECKFALRET